MPFAAAAVIGSGRGAGRFGGRRPYPARLPDEPQVRGGTVVTCIATCASVALVATGLSLLVHSLTNTRGALVADYDSRVEQWEHGERGAFAAVDMDIVAHWGLGRNVTLRMEPSDAQEEFHRDTEHGKGLLPYHALTYLASVEFGTYYPGDQPPRGNQWVPLPDRSVSPHVTFEFTVRSRGGNVSAFSTPALPLVWDEIVHARTPAPDDKCSRERHGVWRNRNCHVVKRLDHVCVQVELDVNGTWVPLRKASPSVTPRSGLSASSPEVVESYGCDPKNSWNPASYSVDPCWGRPVTDRCPQAPRERHTVEVRVRSAVDPYIRAEELTDDKFDFGMSPTSQRANGIVMFLVGLCMGALPCIRLYQFHKRLRESEDCRTLKEEREERGPGGCPAGVYGNSAM